MRGHCEQELAPTVVLEVLAAPITEESLGVRAGALAELQALLWQAGDQNPNLLVSRAARADLMKKAYPLLTAAELVRLTSTPEVQWEHETVGARGECFAVSRTPCSLLFKPVVPSTKWVYPDAGGV